MDRPETAKPSHLKAKSEPEPIEPTPNHSPKERTQHSLMSIQSSKFLANQCRSPASSACSDPDAAVAPSPFGDEDEPKDGQNGKSRLASQGNNKVSQSTFAGCQDDRSDCEDSAVEAWPSEKKRIQQPELRQAASQADVLLQAQFDIVREKNVEVSYETKAWFVVNPQRSNKFAAWQVLTILALAWVVTIVPFQVGLLEPQWGLLLMLSTGVDIIFLADVLLQFITMYPRPTQSGVVWEQKVSRISRHYLKTWFALDAITLIPFDIIDLAFNAESVGTFKGTKVFRALRLLKLMRILKTSRWLHRVEITISLPYQQFALFRFLCILLLVCHWLACTWAMSLQFSDPVKPRWIDATRLSLALICFGDCFKIPHQKVRVLFLEHVLVFPAQCITRTGTHADN